VELVLNLVGSLLVGRLHLLSIVVFPAIFLLGAVESYEISLMR
jgi:hypothetical protein